MVKRVAFVDIDGCLVQNRKLNAALVEQLKKYDAVILFTQRSIFLQKLNITHLYANHFSKTLEPPLTDNDIIITADAIAQLEKMLKRNDIKVSTSVDAAFGDSLNYYDVGLNVFEQALKAEMQSLSSLDNYTFSDTLKQLYKHEVTEVKSCYAVNEQDDPATFYPQGKIEQCNHLMKTLPSLLGSSDNFDVDYFDDSIKNINEIQSAKHSELEQKPKCFIVSGAYICPVEQFKKKYGDTANPRERKIEQELQQDPLVKVLQYLAKKGQKKKLSSMRKNNKKQSGSEPRANFTRFFKRGFKEHKMSVKVSAANKLTQILYGDNKVVMTDKELSTLVKLKNKNIINDEVIQLVIKQQNQPKQYYQVL